MVASKKTGGEKIEAKKKLMILAVIPKSVGLTAKERQALEKALKTSGKTSVKSLASLNTVAVCVPEGD